MTTTTDATGAYQFSWNESVPGYYLYAAFYDGNATYASTAASTGVVVSINPTTLTVTAPTTVTVNQNFTINGTLTSGTSGIPAAAITLQRSTDNVQYTNVSINQTTSTGAYQFSWNESTPGTYYYRATFPGNAIYTASSAVKTVAVTAYNTT